VTVEPPPVNGIGGAAGFKMMLEDRANVGTAILEAAAGIWSRGQCQIHA